MGIVIRSFQKSFLVFYARLVLGAGAGKMLMMMMLSSDANDRYVLKTEVERGKENPKQLIHHTCTMYDVHDELSQLTLEVS